MKKLLLTFGFLSTIFLGNSSIAAAREEELGQRTVSPVSPSAGGGFGAAADPVVEVATASPTMIGAGVRAGESHSADMFENWATTVKNLMDAIGSADSALKASKEDHRSNNSAATLEGITYPVRHRALAVHAASYDDVRKMFDDLNNAFQSNEAKIAEIRSTLNDYEAPLASLKMAQDKSIEVLRTANEELAIKQTACANYWLAIEKIKSGSTDQVAQFRAMLDWIEGQADAMKKTVHTLALEGLIESTQKEIEERKSQIDSLSSTLAGLEEKRKELRDLQADSDAKRRIIDTSDKLKLVSGAKTLWDEFMKEEETLKGVLDGACTALTTYVNSILGSHPKAADLNDENQTTVLVGWHAALSKLLTAVSDEGDAFSNDMHRTLKESVQNHVEGFWHYLKPQPTPENFSLREEASGVSAADAPSVAEGVEVVASGVPAADDLAVRVGSAEPADGLAVGSAEPAHALSEEAASGVPAVHALRVPEGVEVVASVVPAADGLAVRGGSAEPVDALAVGGASAAASDALSEEAASGEKAEPTPQREQPVRQGY